MTIWPLLSKHRMVSARNTRSAIGLVAGCLATSVAAQALNPLSVDEMRIATERATQSVAAVQPIGRSNPPTNGAAPTRRYEVLTLERRPPEKSAAASAPRRANVSVYDYDTNRLYLLVVNLQSGAIESMQSQQQQQPALNANEIKRAASILAKDAAAVQAIAHAYARASGGPPSSHDAIDTSTLVFSRLFATGQTNQRSEKCGAHRCAQIMFFALENVVLDTIAVIDLSRGEVAQLLPFGDARAQ